MMELYKELLAHVLSHEEVCVTFPGLQINAAQIMEMECYKTLQKIKAVIEDDSLADDACFMKIEEIVNIFESIGSDGGERHDFG